MEKEGLGNLFNSRDGKVNILLLFSVVLIFVVMLLSVHAFSITSIAPRNLTFNGTRNVNFTFIVTWGGDGDNGTSNCSIYINTTGSTGNLWDIARNFSTTSTGDMATDTRITNGSLSYANYTFSSDGNYTFNIGCFTTNITTTGGTVNTFNFSGGSKGSQNLTFFLDSVAPTIVLDTPKGGVLADTTYYNITGYDTATFYVNVSDNSTRTVWMILVNSSVVIPSFPGPAMNESAANSCAACGNRSMAFVTSIAYDYRQYLFNLSPILNFSSNFTGPGTHSVIFCANDSQSRITCTNRSDYVIKGGNITQIENVFSNLNQGLGGASFGGLNITFGNGTEIPEGTFLNPISGVSFGGVLVKNFTFIFNVSPSVIIYIVGMRMDESQFGNASNTRVNSTPSREIAQQVGTGFRAQMAWADINSFLPTASIYEYGMMQLGGTGYSKKMYCNGTTVADPQCHNINQCNSTLFDIYNNTNVIPTNDACWLEALSTNDINVNNKNLSATTPGFTYIFVDHFSGGLGGSDYSQINATFNGPLFNNLSTATALNIINFTLEDINSTGLNLTLNFSINVSITDSGGGKTFNYLNASSTNLTCVTSDIVSPQNTTSVTCNVTFAFSNGTFIINITARDASNNSNPVNISTGFINITVDQIPPRLTYFNISTNASIPTSLGNGTSDGSVKTFDKSDFGSVRQGARIFLAANWTDNLTKPLRGDWQAFNDSANNGAGAWVTINESNMTPFATNGNWLNLSFNISTGHNMFEGKNVSFRIRANDTLGNMNISGVNITIQINDTTKPTLLVSSVAGAADLNGTNITSAAPIIVYNITENSALRNISIQIDSLTETNCGYRNFISQATANANRNSSIDLFSAAGCTPLSNGTHTVRLTAEDSWGNSELYIHSFNLQSGTVPIIQFISLSNGLSTVNQSNVTPYTTMNFSAVAPGSTIKNISWTSSCNSSSNVFTNNITLITPFNYSGCKGISANQTVTITAFDFSSNTNSTTFGFLVDDLGPSLSVAAPTNGFSGTSNLSISLSAKDDSQRIDFFAYYLDSSSSLVRLNVSGNIPEAATNISLFNITNFTAGTHTIKFTVNDSLGNYVNSSVITFVATGDVHFGKVNSSMNSYVGTALGTNITNVTIRIKTGTGYEPVNGSNETSTNTFEILFEITGNSTNISLTEINGSAVNWDKINFTPEINRTNLITGIQNNWSLTVVDRRIVSFNNSLEEFVTNNNSYYGVVVFPLNDSGRTPAGPEFWWIPDEGVLTTRVNISQCTAAFTPTTTTPCFNYTANGKTIVQVPHFSIVAVVNDSSGPTITVNIPDRNTGNQTVSMFVPNITVSSDAVSCIYQVNGSTPISMIKTGTTCIGQTERFVNANERNNITFNATDASGNVGTLNFLLNVSDTTAPPTPNSSLVSSSVGTTTTTITVGAMNETVNATIFYGTTVSSLSSTGMETDFNATQAVSLTGLTASAQYFYNVTICDFAGNCATNGTFNFTTSAAAAAAAATTSSSSSGGGSAGGEVTTPTVATVASAGRQWDSLEAGTSGVLTIHKDDIAVTGVTIDVKNTVSNPSLTVGSLESNPVATAAAAAKVYQYLQITKSNIADADASKITLNFKVSKSWLTTNGVAESNVILWRYSDNKWNQLPTTKTGEDSTYYMYQATTPGLSYFAIGNKEAGTSAFAIIDMIRDFYAGTSKLTAFDIIDQIRSFYGG